jgi:hypothetical protein
MIVHIKRFHGVNVGGGIPCGQNYCPRQFFNFRNLRRHLTTAHANLVSVRDDDEGELGLLNVDNVASPMADSEPLHSECESADVTNSKLDLKGMVQAAFLSFITKLQARANVLMTDTKFVTDNLLELLQDVSTLSIERIRAVLTELNIDQTVECVQNLYKDLECIPVCIEEVSTEHKQMAFLKKKWLLHYPTNMFHRLAN